MKLVEALVNGPLADARVVAGGAGLDKEITWVQVVDHPDIESWVKEGHLLLSTGYNWPKEELPAFAIVEKLAAKGIAGVVLAVPHFLEHFPSASVEAAERHGLPLLEIPWEVPFSEITQAVHRELVDQQSRALARSEQIHRELTQAAVSGHSLHDVARVLGQVLDRPVAILGIDGIVLGEFTRGDGSTSDGAAADSATDVYRLLKEDNALALLDGAPHPIRLRLTTPRTRSLIGYPVRVRDERAGYVIVCDDEPALSMLDLRAIEHAGTVAALQISHQRELSVQEARLGYALVASLIEGRFEPTPQALERARLLGWNDTTRLRLCTVLLDEPNPLSREGFDKREAFAAQAALVLEGRGLRPLLSLSANQIHMLLPQPLDPDAWWAEFQPTRMAMAVSQVHVGVEGMAAAGRETAELIEHLRPGRVHHFEQMLFPRVLKGDADAQRLFVERLLGSFDERKRGHQLLDTAVALAEEGFHLQRSAERLGVHISTLRYRLDRLAEQTGLNLDSADGRFQLQVAVRLYLMER